MDKEENTALSFLTISKAQAGSAAPRDGKDPVVLLFFVLLPSVQNEKCLSLSTESFQRLTKRGKSLVVRTQISNTALPQKEAENAVLLHNLEKGW